MNAGRIFCVDVAKNAQISAKIAEGGNHSPSPSSQLAFFFVMLYTVISQQ